MSSWLEEREGENQGQFPFRYLVSVWIAFGIHSVLSVFLG